MAEKPTWYTDTKGPRILTAMNLNKTEINMTSQIPYVETDITEYAKSHFLMENFKNKRSVFGRKLLIERSNLTDEALYDFIGSFLPDYSIIMTRVNSRLTIISDTSDTLMILVAPTPTSVSINISGSKELVALVELKLTTTYNVIDCSIEWVTSQDMNSVTIPLVKPKGVVNQSYPFIKEGIDAFVDNYLNGPENVLLLIGPPGTGKCLGPDEEINIFVDDELYAKLNDFVSTQKKKLKKA